MPISVPAKTKHKINSVECDKKRRLFLNGSVVIESWINEHRLFTFDRHLSWNSQSYKHIPVCSSSFDQHSQWWKIEIILAYRIIWILIKSITATQGSVMNPNRFEKKNGKSTFFVCLLEFYSKHTEFMTHIELKSELTMMKSEWVIILNDSHSLTLLWIWIFNSYFTLYF